MFCDAFPASFSCLFREVTKILLFSRCSSVGFKSSQSTKLCVCAFFLKTSAFLYFCILQTVNCGTFTPALRSLLLMLFTALTAFLLLTAVVFLVLLIPHLLLNTPVGIWLNWLGLILNNLCIQQ